MIEERFSVNDKSEEVQAIIERMPTYWVKWVTLAVSIMMGILIILGFLIQYPDTVDGQISVTASKAPVHLVANANGRIHLLQSNKNRLEKGSVISYIENGANYKHILLLDSLLSMVDLSSGNYLLPDTLILGEISSSYNAFLLSHQQYHRLLSSNLYVTMRLNLQQQIIWDETMIANLDKEITLKNTILDKSMKRLGKDSILFMMRGISEQEFEQQQATFLSLQETQLNIESSRLMKYSEVSRNKMEIQRIMLEEAENKEKAFSDYITHKSELVNIISQWKERYLQCSPIDGELEYLGFWRNDCFVQSGQELFTVIPNKNDILGEVMIPSHGSGKVEVGQIANVKINNYPYDEYGLLNGVVTSISRINNKIKIQDGTGDVYLVMIAFPKGTITNYGKILPLDFETKGMVEIITKRKRLIERLFDNLKSKGEK